MCLVFWIQEKLDGNREPLWLFPSLYSVQMNSSQLEEKIIVVVLWDQARSFLHSEAVSEEDMLYLHDNSFLQLHI